MTAPVEGGGRLVAVLDVGKTNVKLVLVDGSRGAEVWARTMPNAVRQDGPYPHVDVARIEAFVLDGLAEVARLAGDALQAVSVTAHGASGGLIGPGGLALPILDYEHDGPDRLAAAYDAVRPAFAETLSPRLAGGLNWGAQLFWQERCFPQGFAAASAIVPYPQYWSWWLSGIASTERTSLGTHTDLWAPRAGCFSTLVGAMGWTARMPPLRSAFDVLGPVRPDIARRIGLTRPVPVLCGIHDSNASLLPHLQGEGAPLSVVSTGTWVILFAVGGGLDRLDPRRHMLANVDAFGRAVPSARFMGGREFDRLTDHDPVEPDQAAVTRVVEQGVMALPSFASGSGPFPRAKGQWSHDPAHLSRAERAVAATLYVALMTNTSLALLEAQGPTIVEGPFAGNALFRHALAALTGRPVLVSSGSTGTSLGAARLAMPDEAPPHRLDRLPPRFDCGTAFAAYAAGWRRAAGSNGDDVTASPAS